MNNFPTLAQEALIHHKLLTALTRYDEREARKPRTYNRYALAHYCGALGRVMEAIERGKTVREALTDNFCGRLLDVCLRAVGEPKSTREEQMGGLY